MGWFLIWFVPFNMLKFVVFSLAITLGLCKYSSLHDIDCHWRSLRVKQKIFFCEGAEPIGPGRPIPLPHKTLDVGKNFVPKIIQGENANEGEFPYMVSLNYDGDGHACGASVITSNWVLTAAHCCLTWGILMK